MKKKKSTALLLALLMMASVFSNAISVFAEGKPEIPKMNQSVEKVEKVKAEDKKNDTEEVKASGDKKDSEKTEAKVELKKSDGLEISKEDVPEAVGAPAAFDLSKINTVAKGADGKFYGIRDYGNTWDNVSTKYFYEISEEDYNTLSQKFLMTFKRKDGQPFKIYDAKMGDGDINDTTPNYYGKPEALLTEMQLRDNMAYDTTIAGNYSPMKVTGQENLIWSIELNKDWDIKATPGFTNGSNTRSIYMFYDVELDGKGHKIHRADNKNDIILQFGSGYSGAGAQVRTANLKNLTIDGGEKYNCIKVNDKGVLNLENAQIIKGDSKQANYGAGITLGLEAKLSMDAKSSITDCFAIRGGAINAWENTVVNINGSNVSNNLADLGGAICSLDKESTINIKNATFDNNQAILSPQGGYGYGGAIYTQSNTSIENSTFTNNFAQTYGGAIYHTSATKFDIKASNFKNNGILKIPQGTIFTENGGAIYAGNKVNISDNCNFELNIASKKGGAICAGDKADINNAIFVNNQSQTGGAVYAEKVANIISSKFTKNKGHWGGAVFDDGNSSFNGTTFEKNTAMYYGAGIYTREGINVTDSKFIENTNMQGTKFQGAGIYIAEKAPNTTKVTNTLFEKNSAPSGGAGIFVGNNSKLEVGNSRFIQNDAARGAGISSAANDSIDTNLSNIKVDSSLFTENLSYMGAGIFTAFPTEINSCTFTRNKAALQQGDNEKNPHDSGVGGAVEVMDNKTVIKASTFEENYAYGSGGALGISGVTRNEEKDIKSIKENINVEISEGTKFIGNTCGVGQGGAIYTIPYLYDIEGYKTDVPENALKEKAYSNLTTAADTVFKENVALSGFVDPPTNFAKYTNLQFDRNSFKDVLPGKDVAKSLLNNYDVNYKNKKLTAFFDPNGGEFRNGENPKDIKLVKGEKDKEIILLDAPKREGYKFTGWKCSMNIPEDILKELPEILGQLKDGKIYKAGDKFNLDADYIFVAQWEPDPNKPDEPKKPHTPSNPSKPEKPNDWLHLTPVDTPLLNRQDHAQYMIGYKDETFKPDNQMSRQEVTVMFSRLLNERPQKGVIYSQDYKDISDDLWSVTAISYMSKLGMVKGYPDGNFMPRADITRAEFAAMATRFADISAGSKTFTDVAKDHWAYDVIQKAAEAGWIAGYPDGSFKPDQPITRAEVVSIINRMLNRYADETFVNRNPNDINRYIDMDKNHWAYYPVVEATNGHRYERKDNGKDETWFEVNDTTFVYDK